jgi:hypothetical protein
VEHRHSGTIGTFGGLVGEKTPHNHGVIVPARSPNEILYEPHEVTTGLEKCENSLV